MVQALGKFRSCFFFFFNSKLIFGSKEIITLPNSSSAPAPLDPCVMSVVPVARGVDDPEPQELWCLRSIGAAPHTVLLVVLGSRERERQV